LGYGDGFSSRLQGQQVIIDGKRMPIIGKICMDQIMIKLDQCYPVGTKVTLIGEEKGEKIELL
jgi:alanine racemase